VARYKVVSAFCLGGGHDVYIGETIDLDDYAGRMKVAQGFVVRLPEEETPPAPAAALAEADDDLPSSAGPRGEPAQAEHGDPEPTIRRRRGG